jgi:hypothetical protein
MVHPLENKSLNQKNWSSLQKLVAVPKMHRSVDMEIIGMM